MLNGGLVIKEAANQHYCTDAFSRAALVAVLENAQVPYQAFANRSDMAAAPRWAIFPTFGEHACRGCGLAAACYAFEF